MWIHKYSFHVWIHNRNLSYDSFEFISMNSYAIFHYWIQYHEFRTLNSHLFSVLNSYHEFMLMKSYSWIQIGYNEFLYLNSYTFEFIWEFRIYTFEFIHMNSYIHLTNEFTCIWILIIISYMNSYVYEFTFMNSYMNSYKLYDFSYMNSHVLWIHIWIRMYQGSRWRVPHQCGAFAAPRACGRVRRGEPGLGGWSARYSRAPQLLMYGPKKL